MVGVVIGRLLVAVGERAMYHWVLPVDSFVYQFAAMGALSALSLALFISYLSLIPRKIFVFPDHLRVESLAFRSWRIGPDDVEELVLARFATVWLSRRILTTLPFTLALFRPGVYLGLKNRRGLFLRSGQPDELRRVMSAALAVGATADAAKGEAPADVDGS